MSDSGCHVHSLQPNNALMLGLPDEVLLKVALNINGDTRNADIQSLALTHPRFRGVAREALIRNGIVLTRNIPEYICALARQPTLISMIKHIEFGYEKRWRPTNSLSSEALAIAKSTILSLGIPVDKYFFMGNLPEEIPCNVLFVILHELKAVTIRTNCFPVPGQYRDVWGSPRLDPFSMVIKGLLGQRIEVLDIVAATHRRREGPPETPISLQHLQSLRVVNLAGEFIPTPKECGWGIYRPSAYEQRFGAQVIFPPSLHIINLYYSETTCSWEWLDILQKAVASQRFPDLGQVNLFFSLSCQALARYIVREHYSAASVLVTKVASILQGLGGLLCLETLFLKPGHSNRLTRDPSLFERGSLLSELRHVQDSM